MRVRNIIVDGRAALAVDIPTGLVLPVRYTDSLPRTTDELIAAGPAGLAALEAWLLARDPAVPVDFPDADAVPHAPAVLDPGHILCAGLNYALHVAEGQDGPRDLPAEPVWFSKFTSCLAAHGDSIELLPEAREHDFEAEIVVVIGRTARRISEAEAPDVIWGYTLGNDVSARDLQRRSTQWMIGKNGDGFAPVGPAITTADCVDASRLDIESWRRRPGESQAVRYQRGETAELLFGFARLISDISQMVTLQPGDLIFTGTPSGVIMGRPPGERHWLEEGDEVMIRSAQLGELRNRFR
ncbi:MAG: fumarylacetoacetate hydrolase family protein [Bacillota bacterium]|nr:fumarylacetoacetate hydrolase family protein [Bacillota bacterium]